LASYKTRDINTSLLRKGFKPKDTDHHFYYFTHEGKKTSVYTKTSHGKSSVDDINLIGKMQKQLHLNKNQFKLLIECPLGENEYIEILRSKNVLKI
jgi:hypothetical protein